MLVAALVDFGRSLRCGDDDDVGGISTRLYGRDVWLLRSRFLPDLSATVAGVRPLRLDDLQQSYALGGDCRGVRDAVLPAGLNSCQFRKSIYSRYAADHFSNRRYDVTYVSAEGRTGHQDSTGCAGGQSRLRVGISDGWDQRR